MFMHVCCYFCNYFGAVTNLGFILESLNCDIIFQGYFLVNEPCFHIHLAVTKEEKETAYNVQLLKAKYVHFNDV